MIDNRLERCPDCNSPVHMVSDVCHEIKAHGLHISCPNCGVKTRPYTVLIENDNQEKAEAQLIKYWNDFANKTKLEAIEILKNNAFDIATNTKTYDVDRRNAATKNYALLLIAQALSKRKEE